VNSLKSNKLLYEKLVKDIERACANIGLKDLEVGQSSFQELMQELKMVKLDKMLPQEKILIQQLWDVELGCKLEDSTASLSNITCLFGGIFNVQFIEILLG
jgi:hypothetical protein